MEHATLMLATSQLGITICSLLILNVSEPAIHHLLAGAARPHRLVRGTVDRRSRSSIALLLVSYLHVVFGEMVPKNLSFSVPDRAVLHARDRRSCGSSRLFHPVIVALNWIANARAAALRRRAEGRGRRRRSRSRRWRRSSNQSRSEGVLDDATGTLSAAFEFTDKKVEGRRGAARRSS